MIKVFCDGCDVELVTATKLVIMHKGIPAPKDLCYTCLAFLQEVQAEAFRTLRGIAPEERRKLRNKLAELV